MMNSADQASMYRAMGFPVPPSTALKRLPRPKYVKLVPGDRGEHLPDFVFEGKHFGHNPESLCRLVFDGIDPRDFNPQPGPLGQIHAWGLYPYDDEREPVISEGNKLLNWPFFDGIEAAMRKMTYQMIYHDLLSPEEQFMKVIVGRKVDLNGLDKCDVLCRIVLPGINDKKGEPRIWRQFRVSAGTTLSAFQDKVIAPIMGWVRNFHSYTFTDFRDGAIFGPEGSNSIDQVHIAHVGYEYLPDNKYKLAHLFSKEGDKIGYLYDFGDKWYHVIEILKIYPAEESTGAVEVIDGRGMCPGENLHGNITYHNFLMEYEDASYSGKAQKKKEILSEPNYNSFGKPPALFDPSSFDLGAAKERVAQALSSATSVRTGTKKYHIPFAPDSKNSILNLEKLHLKKGQTLLNSYESEDETTGFWNETVSNKKDSRKEAVCGYCGKPASPEVELKACAGCQQVLYCSKDHQKAHWKTLHKKQCSQKYPKPKKQ